METRKINIDRPKISSSEIQAKQNFAQVQAGANIMAKPFYQSTWFGATVASVAIIAVTSAILLSGDPKEKQENNQAQTEQIVSDSTKNLVTYAEDAPCILPPVKGKEKVFDSYTVNVDDKTSFTHQTGSEITIPKGSIVDENGNKVTGDIDIQYREYHNQTDILLSGIPMEYDSAGTKYTFESAGMLQIYGYQNGKQVFINPKKPIEVKMVSNYEGSHYNLYELDTVSRNWVNKGKDEIVYEQTRSNPSNDVQINLNGNDISSNEVELQEEVKKTYKAKEQKKTGWVAAKEEVKQVQKTEPREPQAFDETLPHFDLSVDPNEFPEIAVYEGVNFEPVGNDFSLDFGKTVWNSITLKKTSEENLYLVTLKKGSLIESFEAKPVFEGEDLKKAQKVFEQKFADYSKKLEDRKEKEAQKQKEYEAAKAKWEAAKAQFEREREARLAAERQRSRNLNNTNKMYRTFNVFNFGTWNCDTPVRIPRGRTVLASFKNKIAGIAIAFASVKLIIKSKNAVFNLSGERMRKLSYNPKEENILVGFLPSGEMAIFKPSDFNDIKIGTKDYEFEMDVINVDELSEKEIEAWIMG